MNSLYLKILTFIFQSKVRREKHVEERKIFLLTYYVPVCHGVSLWRDVVF